MQYFIAFSIPIMLIIYLQSIDIIVAINYTQFENYDIKLFFYNEHLYALFTINPFYCHSNT